MVHTASAKPATPRWRMLKLCSVPLPHEPHVERAEPDDVAALHRLRRQLEDWLHSKNIQQWPRGEVGPDVIAGQVNRREWLLVRDPRVGIAAAMRVLFADPDFWGDDDTPAVYVHGLMVDRAASGLGLGACMLENAVTIGRSRGAQVCRLDCAETNGALRSFYGSQEFHEVGRCDFPGLFSVTLFEKAIRPTIP